MKTERRHELETNELSDWLTKFLNDIKPYSKLITAVAVLLAVGIFLFSFGAAQRRKSRGLAWADLFAIQVNAANTFDPQAKLDYVDRLVDLADREKGSPVGAWALQYAGDISLALGSEMMWQDRAEAVQRFQAAVGNYESALTRANHDVLRQRALMGLAQANEALNDFSAAESNYQTIIERWPDTSVATSAGERIALLKQASTQEFYDWFLKQQPPKPQQPAASPGVGPSGNDPFSVTPPRKSLFAPADNRADRTEGTETPVETGTQGIERTESTETE